MQCSFQVGDDVICIEDIPSKNPEWVKAGVTFPEVDRIYKIREIKPDSLKANIIGLLLVEIVNPERFFNRSNGTTVLTEPQFNYLSFRPVKKTSIEDFTKFLKKTPTKIETRVPELV